MGERTTPPSLHRYLYAYANPTVWVDPTGHYNEGGHYYTTIVVARAAGYSPEQAAKLAMHAQIPDEVSRYDAISRAANEGGSLLSGNPIKYIRDRLDRIMYQEGLHVLSGKEADREQDNALKIIRDADKGNLAEIGTAIHPLGDSFSHRTLEDTSKTYGPFLGHAKDGVDPDVIHGRKDMYFKYVETLATALAEKNGAKMTKEDISGLQSSLWAAVEKSKVPRYRVVNEYVNAQSTSGGYFHDTQYEIPGSVDDKKTNIGTIANLRELAISRMKDGGDGNSNPERIMLKPENNDLLLHGAFTGRGDERRELKNLLETRPETNKPTKKEVDELWGEVAPATDSVVRKMNSTR